MYHPKTVKTTPGSAVVTAGEVRAVARILRGVGLVTFESAAALAAAAGQQPPQPPQPPSEEQEGQPGEAEAEVEEEDPPSLSALVAALAALERRRLAGTGMPTLPPPGAKPQPSKLRGSGSVSSFFALENESGGAAEADEEEASLGPPPVTPTLP